MRVSLYLILYFFISTLVSGCASSTCEGLCHHIESCRHNGEEWDECQSTCETDYSRASNYCRYALSELASCIDIQECKPAFTDCEDERLIAIDDCGCGMIEPNETCQALVTISVPPDE